MSMGASLGQQDTILPHHPSFPQWRGNGRASGKTFLVDTVTLDCTIPPPRLHWQRNGGASGRSPSTSRPSFLRIPLRQRPGWPWENLLGGQPSFWTSTPCFFFATAAASAFTCRMHTIVYHPGPAMQPPRHCRGFGIAFVGCHNLSFWTGHATTLPAPGKE